MNSKILRSERFTKETSLASLDLKLIENRIKEDMTKNEHQRLSQTSKNSILKDSARSYISEDKTSLATFCKKKMRNRIHVLFGDYYVNISDEKEKSELCSFCLRSTVPARRMLFNWKGRGGQAKRIYSKNG